ncbi:MAG: sensor histidine kinase, partial [Nitrospinaceae bacterium]
NLSNHLQTVREEERTRISREIHDELGQILTTLKMELSLLGERAQEENLPIQEDVDSMTRLLETTLQTVRRISSELRPGILDVLGLAEALEWHVQEFQKRTSVRIETKVDRVSLGLGKDYATACFRICQEALTNVARHASATRVTVTLQNKISVLDLTVHDNGRGITKEEVSNPTSLGLIGMRERAQALKGTLSITGTPKKGTTVHVSFPLKSGS